MIRDVPKLTIRHAAPIDRLSVVSMAKTFHGASKSPFPFSAPYAAQMFDRSITEPDRVALVVDDGERLKGALLAYSYPYPLGNFTVATETFWWLSPRHWRVMPELLAAYEMWARSIGCSLAGMGMIGGRSACGLFERSGYQPVEKMFAKQL